VYVVYGMDLRRLAPVDHRYGTLIYDVWEPDRIVGGNNADLMLIRCFMGFMGFMETDSVVVNWWMSNHRYAKRIVHMSTTRTSGEMVILLSDLTQAFATNLRIEGIPEDPLV
jgi:hypothetical protein